MSYNSVISYTNIDYTIIILFIVIAILLMITDRLLLMIYDLKNKKFLEILSPITYMIILFFVIQKYGITEYAITPKLEDAKEINYFYTDKVVGIYYYDIGYKYNNNDKRNAIKISAIDTYKIKYDNKEVILSNKVISDNIYESYLIDLTGYKNKKLLIKIYDVNDKHIDDLEITIK